MVLSSLERRIDILFLRHAVGVAVTASFTTGNCGDGFACTFGGFGCGVRMRYRSCGPSLPLSPTISLGSYTGNVGFDSKGYTTVSSLTLTIANGEVKEAEVIIIGAESPVDDKDTTVACSNGESCDSRMLSSDGDVAEFAVTDLEDGSGTTCYLVMYATV